MEFKQNKQINFPVWIEAWMGIVIYLTVKNHLRPVTDPTANRRAAVDR